MRYAMVRRHDRSHVAQVFGDEVLLAADPALTLDALIAAAEYGKQLFQPGERLPLASVSFLAPLQPKKNVFCVGRNYLAHAEEITRARGIALDLPDVPTFFTKAPTTVIAHNAVAHLDRKLSQQYDWEAELAVIIGKRCRDVEEDDALHVVFGYCCMNDLSARDLQQKHVQWFKGKSLDGKRSARSVDCHGRRTRRSPNPAGDVSRKRDDETGCVDGTHDFPGCTHHRRTFTRAHPRSR